MAQRGAEIHTARFSCSICLDHFKDPVTIPCGHNFCMECIQNWWNESGVQESCPQCRRTFTSRPALVKNTMLADMVDVLKRKAPQAAPADQSTSPPPKKQKPVELSREQRNMCPLHNQPMDMFCLTDQQSICLICRVYDCRSHPTVPAADERKRREKNLQDIQLVIEQRIQFAEGNLSILEQEVKAIDDYADETVETCKDIFRQQIWDVEQQVKSRQQTDVRQARELQEKLQQEITELKRRNERIMQLICTDDHVHFLQSYSSVSALSQPTDSSSFQAAALSYFEGVTAAVSEVGDRLQNILRETLTNISERVTEVLQPEPEPTTRDEFLQYACTVTLDPNTAHRSVTLLQENTKALYVNIEMPYDNHPDRFTGYFQVLAKEGLTGRCYWEVDFCGEVSIAVSYKDISRVGGENECGFGYNDKSCALQCCDGNYRFWHNNAVTPVSGPHTTRVGVYLDHTAGILSFYSVSETMTLLHRGHTSFTQPLYAGLLLGGPLSIAEVLSSANSNRLRSLQVI